MIKIHRIRVLADGSIKIGVNPHPSDVAYVKGLLENQKDVEVVESPSNGSTAGTPVYLLARGSKSNPLELETLTRVFQDDVEIELTDPEL